jgi:hypothetical protein
MMKNKGTDYTYCYQEAYEAKSRRKNMQIAGAGWAIGAGVALLILFSSN